MSRAPDYTTMRTRRWRSAFDADTSPATVAVWLVEAPWMHPLWQHHGVFIVHLRGEVDGKPAVIVMPGATHEFLVAALDPNHQPSADQPEDWRWLSPISICQQFFADSDADAAAKVEQLLFGVDEEWLTLDSDGRSVWHRLLLERTQGGNDARTSE